jgi:ABC-type bacteriocin/lantibiotic exporter with double-glycine peptidase domain
MVMFDLAIFANPGRLKREFLKSTDVATQPMGSELRAEFEQIKDENADVLITGHFWRDFCRTYKKHISLLVLGRAITTLLVLVAVLASQRILDESNSLTASLWLLVFFAVAQFVQRIVNAWSALLQSQLLVCTRTFVTLRMNYKLLRMGQLTSDEFSTGNLKTLISSDIYRIADFLHSVSRNGMPCLLALIFLGPVIWMYMGVPGLIAVLAGFGAMPLAYFISGYVHKKEGLIKTEEDTLGTIIGEWVTNVRLLRFLGWEQLMRKKVAAHVRRLVTESTKQHGVNLINFGISVSWWLMPIIALVYANEVMGHSDDLATLFASIWMLNHITMYIRWLPGMFIGHASASACVKRLNTLFEHSDIRDQQMPDCERSVADALPTKMHFSDVSFKYQEDWILNHVNVQLDLREHTSLIGTVGSGKSTLLKLICAEIKPTEGAILVEFDNGVIANLWHRNVYDKVRSEFGYMPQEAYLSNTSLAINVSLDAEFGNGDVMQAIRLAELEADIHHWQRGVEEEVGEIGVNLSGGQKQRVNLARALYSSRPYLVLDDPLSAVDTDTESALMATLLSGPEGFLLSSHRLTELIHTDRLLVLDKGKIIEDGDPGELVINPDSEFNRHLLAGESSYA